VCFDRGYASLPATDWDHNPVYGAAVADRLAGRSLPLPKRIQDEEALPRAASHNFL